MPDTLLTRQQEEILALLVRNPDGLNSEGIRNGLKNPPHLRTVQRWLAELAADRHITAWASCRLEGNTYSRLDTQSLIEFGRYPEGERCAGCPDGAEP